MKNYVSIFCKNKRFFVVKEDAVVLHFLMRYKIRSNNIIYFTDLDKVTKTLDYSHINYRVNKQMHEFPDNTYAYFYSNGVNKIRLFNTYARIKMKILSLSLDEKIELFNKVEGFIDGRK